MQISLLLPAIRRDLWKDHYKSIEKSFSGDWEIIMVTPYDEDDLGIDLKKYDRIKHIKDMGTPTRCRQIALLNATGDWCCMSSDDATFFKNSLDDAYEVIKENDMDKRKGYIGRYTEAYKDNPYMLSEDYYRIAFHKFYDPLAWIPKHYRFFNAGLISRELMLEYGGIDCQFEGDAMACVDISLRMQNDGIEMLLLDKPIFHCTHMPGRSGDHGPIHDGQTIHDMPLFLKIWDVSNPTERIHIPLDNWKDTPERWERRFGKE